MSLVDQHAASSCDHFWFWASLSIIIIISSSSSSSICVFMIICMYVCMYEWMYVCGYVGSQFRVYVGVYEYEDIRNINIHTHLI